MQCTPTYRLFIAWKTDDIMQQITACCRNRHALFVMTNPFHKISQHNAYTVKTILRLLPRMIYDENCKANSLAAVFIILFFTC